MGDYELYAIIISIFAIASSFLALGWNIYRDIILKPRLKVKLTMAFITYGDYVSETKICIEATNFGPNKIKCIGIHAKNATLWKRIFRRVEHALIIHKPNDQASSTLPCVLEVGDRFNLLISFRKGCFLAKPFTHVGIMDTFDRIHWAPKKDLAKARKEYKKKFLKKNQSKTPQTTTENTKKDL